MSELWEALGAALDTGGTERARRSPPSRVWALATVAVAAAVCAVALSLRGDDPPQQPSTLSTSTPSTPATSPEPTTSEGHSTVFAETASSMAPKSSPPTATAVPTTTTTPTSSAPTTSQPRTLSSSQPPPTTTTTAQPSPSCVTCKADGRCSLVNGQCAVVSSADCRRSMSCRDYGGCANIGGRCAPASTDDCARSRVACRDKQRCRKVGNFCVK